MNRHKASALSPTGLPPPSGKHPHVTETWVPTPRRVRLGKQKQTDLRVARHQPDAALGLSPHLFPSEPSSSARKELSEDQRMRHVVCVWIGMRQASLCWRVGVGVGCGAGGRRRVWTRTPKSALLLGLPGGLLTRQLGLGLREHHW